MKVRAVDFVSYAVTDMDVAEAFWKDVLGLPVEVARREPGTRGNGYMELDAGGTAIALTVLPSLHPNALPALAVESVADTVTELRGKDVPILMDTIETPVCWMAVIADPDGNRVLLHQRKDGTAG